MSDRLVEVAVFGQAVEAHLARGRLEAEGIRAVVQGAEAAGAFGGVQGVSRVTLHVAESDAERAVGILAAAVADRESEDDLVDEEPFWLCPLCGDSVPLDEPACPACQTPRPETWAVRAAGFPRPAADPQSIQSERPPDRAAITADTPVEAVPSAQEDEPDIPDPETFLGDDLARRAFLSALFGVFFLPVTLYSLWLLLRVALYSGKISDHMMPRLYGAIALDGLVCLAWLLVFGRVLLY